MQLRRVLLLFALVLGLSAVVSSLAPPPEDTPERPRHETPVLAAPSVNPQRAGDTQTVRFEAPARAADRRELPTKRVEAGSSLRVEVEVPEPGDVVLNGLGLRESGHPLAPARFDLLAGPPGRYGVLFLPVRGAPRRVGRLRFAGEAEAPGLERNRPESP